MNTEKTNPLIDSLNTFFYYVVLNMVFVITCLPVFTAGTALASLYYVNIKEQQGEYGYLVRTYLREFKRNFKSGTIAFLILFPIGSMLLFNLLFWPARGTSLSALVTGILIILLIVWLALFHYTFPLIGRFINTPLNSIRNAWGLTLRNIKYTLALLAIDFCTGCFCLFLPLNKVLMVSFTFGIVLIVYLQTVIIRRIFIPYEELSHNSPDEKQSILRKHADMMTGTSQF